MRTTTKRVISGILTIIVIFSMIPTAVFCVSAETATSGTCGENARWSYDENTSTLTISGKGDMFDYPNDYAAPWYSINTRYYYPHIKKIVIGSGITSIGDWAFASSDELSNIIMPQSLIEIGASAFSGCKMLENARIPDSVLNIGEYAFDGCIKLLNVDIPNGVKQIGDGTFRDCNSLLSVIIPNSIERIGESAFESCKSLTEVMIPDSVTSIGYEAFFNCIKLKSIAIGNGVTSIRYGAFGACDKLENIKIGSGFSNLEFTSHNVFTDIFRGSKNIANIDIDSDNTVYRSKGNCIINVQSNELVFGCKSSIVPTDGSVESIGRYAFLNCEEKLDSISIPTGIKYIGEGAFQGCISLTDIVIPKSVEYIGEAAFAGCTGVLNVIVENGNPRYHSNGTCIIDTASKCLISGFNNTIIPADDSVNSIGRYAFYFCNLKSLSIPNSITGIDSYAFFYCYELTNVEISSNAQYIGSGAFYYCKNLKDIIIPYSVTYIGSRAFDSCEHLNTIRIFNENCEIANNDSIGNSIPNNTIIFGKKDSTAEQYALQNGNTFFTLDSTENYYQNYGDTYYFGIIDKDGSSLLDSCIMVEDQNYKQQYAVKSNLTGIKIPKDFNGNITVSKPGYITVTFPFSDFQRYHASYFEFITLYPEKTASPMVQQMRLYNKNNTGFVTNLMRDYEYMYDMSGTKYDLYLDVRSKQSTITNMYLQQGNKRIQLQNGENSNLPINGTFNSSGGVIYFCIVTNDGTIYKRNSHIIAKKSSISVSLKDSSSMTTTIDDSIDAIGGKTLAAKFSVGNIPVKLDWSENGTFKGTIGVQASDSSTATFYDTIKSTIVKHSCNGDADFPTLEMAKLDNYIKNAGGQFVESYSTFGINVKAKIVGYIEGNIDPITGEVENLKTGCVMSVSGNMSYTQQSIAFVLPYYWTVNFEAEIAMQLKAIKDNKNPDNDFSLELPAISVKLGISGDLCAGINKIAGGGVRLSGAVKATFDYPFTFEDSVWTVTVDFNLIGQIAGFEQSFTPFGDHLINYQIYPKVDNSASKIVAEKLKSNTKLLSRNYLDKASVFMTTSNDTDIQTIKSNTYTYTAPQTVSLSNGNTLLVWIDDDSDRTDINRTALYYSVYDCTKKIWSEPKQVENDGTADFSPVLKNLNGKPYLLWSNCSKVLNDDADMNSVLSCIDISFASFDGKDFSEISKINSNNCMDVMPDIAIIDGFPVVIWISNTENDVFLSEGNTKIHKAIKKGSSWEITEVAGNLNGINSITIIEEDKSPAIYYSADTDGNFMTSDDCEIFKIKNNEVSQITQNNVMDSYIVSFNNRVYWNSNGSVTNGTDTISCENLNGSFCIVGDNNAAIVYTTFDNSGIEHFNVCYLSEDSWGCTTQLASTENTIGGYAVNYSNGKIQLISNEISRNTDKTANMIIREFVNDDCMRLSDAYYESQSLLAGDYLRVYADITNLGSKTVNGYTVYAYVGNEVLGKIHFTDSLASGDTIQKLLMIKLPGEITFDSICFFVEPGKNSPSLASRYYDLSICRVDASIEKSKIVTEADGSDKLYFAIVNRGSVDLNNLTISLRKGTPDGEILQQKVISNIPIKSEKLLIFNLGVGIAEGTGYYITLEGLDEDNLMSNNSVLVIKEYLQNTDVDVVNISDLYPPLFLNTKTNVTINADNSIRYFVFIPEADGVYTFCSNSKNATYGCIYDSGMNEIISGGSYDENSGFLIEQYLEAGNIYILSAEYYYESDIGTFDIWITDNGRQDSIPGDANGDGAINGQDIIRIKKYLANYDYETGTSSIEIASGADANGDGVISGQDIVRLKKYLANYDYETDTSTIVLGPQK